MTFRRNITDLGHHVTNKAVHIVSNPYRKVEYHANKNPLKYSEKIAYVGQRLMFPKNREKKNNILPS